MDLNGGIKTYVIDNNDILFKRYGDDKSPKGREVKFLNKNGYDLERKYANKHFKEGDILTVKEIYVGRSSSEVEFEEYPGLRFNTVMFEDIK